MRNVPTRSPRARHLFESGKHRQEIGRSSCVSDQQQSNRIRNAPNAEPRAASSMQRARSAGLNCPQRAHPEPRVPPAPPAHPKLQAPRNHLEPPAHPKLQGNNRSRLARKTTRMRTPTRPKGGSGRFCRNEAAPPTTPLEGQRTRAGSALSPCDRRQGQKGGQTSFWVASRLRQYSSASKHGATISSLVSLSHKAFTL